MRGASAAAQAALGLFTKVTCMAEMSAGVEIQLPWWRRVRLLFGGSVYATVIIDASWHVQLKVRPGQAWEYHETSNHMLPQHRVFGMEPARAIDGSTCTIAAK